jgi:hypothetical protein
MYDSCHISDTFFPPTNEDFLTKGPFKYFSPVVYGYCYKVESVNVDVIHCFSFNRYCCMNRAIVDDCIKSRTMLVTAKMRKGPRTHGFWVHQWFVLFMHNVCSSWVDNVDFVRTLPCMYTCSLSISPPGEVGSTVYLSYSSRCPLCLAPAFLPFLRGMQALL